MRKSKYGEETVVMRIPRSLVPRIQAILEGVEVLAVTRHTKSKKASSIDDILSDFPVPVIQEGLRKAYRKGFQAGEEYCVAEQLELSGQSHMIKPVIEAFRGRHPNPESPLLAQAFMNVRRDWYKLIGTGLNSEFLFPTSEDVGALTSEEG